MSSWATWIEGRRNELSNRDLERRLRAFTPRDGLRGTLEGREVVLFCSNDYLGLSFHPDVRTAAAAAGARHGMGPRGASLVCGYTAEHAGLESDLATLVGTEAALVFPTGYAANLAVLASLSGPGTAIYSDELNHASIIDGCRMAHRAGATVHVYRHADPEDLDALLSRSNAPRKLVVTDSVFSMDGDLAPLPEIVQVKSRHGAMLVVDEAHALLVLGENGGGAADELGVARDVEIRVGTLGKAIGAHGGFVACEALLREHVLNHGRPYIYSTALPVPAVAAARAALRVYRGDPGIRATLDGHRDVLGRVIGACSPSAIQKVVLGSEADALRAADRLLEDGWFVPAMRPPTVPEGTSRLRITLSAAHTQAEVEGLVASLEKLG